MGRIARVGAAAGAALLVACGGSSSATAVDAGDAGPEDAGGSIAAPVRDAGIDAGDAAGGADADAGPVKTNIAHVVVIVQENHTFDAYFGHWCTAPAGSSPTCTAGPACCEGAPAHEPSGSAPTALDDHENATWDPNHTQSCELSEIDDGAMDQFVKGGACPDPRNFAIADDVVKPYHDWAAQYAVADRYFQPIAGSSSSNDMYFAVAKYVFTDNEVQPATNGHGCTLPPTPTATYDKQTTIADLILAAGGSFTFYAEGYAAMVQATFCPAAPPDSPAAIPAQPCAYSPSDVPFAFYTQFADQAPYMKDYADLASDIAAGKLPTLSFVKHVQYKNEHPGYDTTISQGVAAVQETVNAIFASPYAKDTLVLLTWDEGGGFFDHVAPPPLSTVDAKPYGTRVPLLALGRFAKKGYVSHVTMEHSSIVRFVEWNFLHATGQLAARDAVVNGLGSLIDPSEAGAVVP